MTRTVAEKRAGWPAAAGLTYGGTRAHPIAVEKPHFIGDDIHRVASLLDHQSRGLSRVHALDAYEHDGAVAGCNY